jgi:hypothetical protein
MDSQGDRVGALENGRVAGRLGFESLLYLGLFRLTWRERDGQDGC